MILLKTVIFSFFIGLQLANCRFIKKLDQFSVCSTNEFKCSNDDKCIPDDWICDSVDDCGDKSDESICSENYGDDSGDECPAGQFACDNGDCIYTSWKCDGDNDCDDETDEENCDVSTKTLIAKRFPIQQADGEVPLVPRIIGGTESIPGEFPWMVTLEAVFSEIIGICGGSIINNRWILTAAHCLIHNGEEATSVELMLGRHDLTSNREGGVTLTSEKIFPHPEFVFAATNGTFANHDIGLVKVPQITFTSRIRSVFLPESCSQTADCSSYVVAGWGITETGIVSDYLKKATIKAQPNWACDEAFGLTLSNGQVCAGEGFPTSCVGDSGGPLMCRIQGQLIQVGTVSFGVEGCSERGVPAIFGNICYYMPWIRSILKEN